MKLRFLNSLSNRKILISLIPVLIVVTLAILWPSISYASISSVVTNILGVIVGAFVWVLGKILVLLINLVIWVAQYNDFINAKAVSNGWVILRDLCNMFFILILLVIAFATTLNRESYAMKALLPKFIIAAILINFSKLICGVIIDFAQVIMLTFVNGFRDIGGGNLADMLGITDIMSISKDPCNDINLWTVVGTFILALIYIIVAVVVITVILFVLIMRMIMIWVYVVLSPLAWLLSVLPATQKYSNQWWQQFAEAVATGPILAFFIWLSFASVQIGVSGKDILGGLEQPGMAGNEETYAKQIGGKETDSKCVGVGVNENGTADGMLKFVISIGLLMGGLIITKQAGGAVGAVAGKVTSGYKALGKRMARPVTDRYKSFQGQREKVRQEKMQAFGTKQYGRYAAATSGAKGIVKAGSAGIKSAIGSTIKGGVNKLADKYDNKYTRSLKAGVDGFNRNEKGHKKADRIDHRNRLQEAYNSGIYNDKDGNDWHYDEKTNTYKPAVKGDDGKDLYKDGKAVIDEGAGSLKDKDGDNVTKMSKVGYDALTAWQAATLDSKAFNNNRKKDETEKQQKKMEDAGFSTGELIAALNNNSASQSDRMAAALTLAVKQGFKDRKDVQLSQSLFKGAQNGGLKKKFNDDVDKKQAYLNHDLSTAGGRKKFGQRLRDGKVDVQESRAYEGKGGAYLVQALDESLNDKEFENQINKITSYSSEHSQAVNSGLSGHFGQPGMNDVDSNGLLSKKLVAAINATNKIDLATSGVSPDKIVDHLAAAFRSISKDKASKVDLSPYKDGQVREAQSKAGYDLADIKVIVESKNADGATQARYKKVYEPDLGEYIDWKEKKAGGEDGEAKKKREIKLK